MSIVNFISSCLTITAWKWEQDIKHVELSCPCSDNVNCEAASASKFFYLLWNSHKIFRQTSGNYWYVHMDMWQSWNIKDTCERKRRLSVWIPKKKKTEETDNDKTVWFSNKRKALIVWIKFSQSQIKLFILKRGSMVCLEIYHSQWDIAIKK